MRNKKKLVQCIYVLAGFLALFIILKIILNSSYRNQLPEYPDFNNISKSLKEQISEAGRRASFNPTSNNLGELGLVYYSSVNYEKAKKCFQLAVKKKNGNWKWSYYLGYLNLEIGDTKASIESFRNVIEKDPKNYLALFYTAEAYQNIGLTDSAKLIFKNVAELNDVDFILKDTIKENEFSLRTYALFNLARIYISANRTDSAKIILNEIIDNQLTFGPAYRQLGIIFNNEGNPALGNQYLNRANDLIDYNPPGDMLIEKISLISRSDTYLLKQIDDAIRSQNFNWALKLFDHSLKYLSDNKFIVSKALFGYLSLGHDKKALPYLNRHINFFKDDFNESLLFASILYSKGYFTQALNYFYQAKKLQPDNSRLALWLADRGRKKEAVTLLNEQLSKNPENLTTLKDAVRLFSNLGDKDKAMTYLTSLKNLEPLSPEVNRLSAEIKENEGDLKEALSVYEEAIRDDPKNLFIIKHLAALYTRNNQWGKLISHYRMSLEQMPNEPFLLEGLGNILIFCPDTKFKNIEEGKELSERAFINFKSSLTIKMSSGKDLATAYALSGDKKNSSKYIKITSDMSIKANASQDYLPYFENLRKQYNIPE